MTAPSWQIHETLPATQMSPSLPVKRWGQYEVVQGTGGRNEVLSFGLHDITYRAIDTRLDRRVHLRSLRPEFLKETALKEAFLSAGRALAKIRHSNISGVLDVGEDGEGCYCALDDPGGETLESVVSRLGFLDVRTALSILDQCAKVLLEIWQSGHVVARLSPSTISACYEAEELIVKFTDLHLAPPGEGGAELAVGKSDDMEAGFCSPEEKALGVLDIRSNIFSLGLIFCELLCGQGSSGSFLALGHRSAISGADPFRKLPEKILYLLELMLERDPARRIQSPYDLRLLIGQCESDRSDFSKVRTNSVEGVALGASFSVEDILPREFNLLGALDSESRYRDAEDRIRGGKAVIRLFGSHESPLEVSICASIAEKISAHPHPNIIRVIRIQTEGRQRFLACEGISGLSLLEIMRKRRRLWISEVLKFLEQAASAADHAIDHDIAGLVFQLSQLRVLTDPRTDEEKNATWMTEPCDQWPPFTLKIPFHGALPGCEADLCAIDPLSTREKRLASCLRALGEITHELLGGVKPRNVPFCEANYTPLSTLSEQGNILLRRALFGGEKPSFSRVHEFLTALKATATEKDFPTSLLPSRSELPKIPEDNGLAPRTRVLFKPVVGRREPLLLAITTVLALLTAVIVFFTTTVKRPHIDNGIVQDGWLQPNVPQGQRGEVNSNALVEAPGGGVQGTLSSSPVEVKPTASSEASPPSQQSAESVELNQAVPTVPVPRVPELGAGRPIEGLPLENPDNANVSAPIEQPLSDEPK